MATSEMDYMNIGGGVAKGTLEIVNNNAGIPQVNGQNMNFNNFCIVSAKDTHGYICLPYIMSGGNYKILILEIGSNGEIKTATTTTTVTFYYKYI